MYAGKLITIKVKDSKLFAQKENMTIRAYEDIDLSTVLEIYKYSKLDELKFEAGDFELIPLDQDPIRWPRFTKSEVYVYDDGDVCAYCALNGSHIEAIYVHPKHRRKGIARTLLCFLLSKINGEASLNVAKNNYPAKNLYAQYGFEVDHEFSTSYNGVEAIANAMVRK